MELIQCVVPVDFMNGTCVFKGALLPDEPL
jgi:hypothetical protein